MQQVMDRVFLLPFMAQAQSARAMKIRKEENEDPYLAVRTEQTRLIRCLLYQLCGFVDYSGKGTFTKCRCSRELREVSKAREISQSCNNLHYLYSIAST